MGRALGADQRPGRGHGEEQRDQIPRKTRELGWAGRECRSRWDFGTPASFLGFVGVRRIQFHRLGQVPFSRGAPSTPEGTKSGINPSLCPKIGN